MKAYRAPSGTSGKMERYDKDVVRIALGWIDGNWTEDTETRMEGLLAFLYNRCYGNERIDSQLTSIFQELEDGTAPELVKYIPKHQKALMRDKLAKWNALGNKSTN